VQYEVHAEREAAEEKEPMTDSQQAKILESCRLEHHQRNTFLEQVDQQLLQCVMSISGGRLPTEKARWLLMEAERQRILELNARILPEETRCEDERLAMKAELTMRRRFAMIQRDDSARGSMPQAKNNGEAGPSRPPTDGEYEGYFRFKFSFFSFKRVHVTKFE
jgi:hypothetical protein